MILIICLDARNGMRFNKRRQSSDKRVILHILQMFSVAIAVRPYSVKLFPKSRITVSDVPNQNAVFFAEEAEYIPIPDSVEKLLVFRWDRVYPADEFFPMEDFLTVFKQTDTVCLTGNSHETIMLEVYER